MSHEDVTNSYVKFLHKYRKPIVFSAFALTISVFYYAITVFDHLNSNGITNTNSESSSTDRLFKNLYVSPDPDIIVVLAHPVWQVTSSNFTQAYFELKSSFEQRCPLAYGIISYFDYPSYSLGLISNDNKETIVTLRIPDASDYDLDDFQNYFSGSELESYFGGFELVNNEIQADLIVDLKKIESISVPILILVLIFAYGGIVATSIPTILAIWTLVMTLAALHVVSNFFQVTTYVRSN